MQPVAIRRIPPQIARPLAVAIGLAFALLLASASLVVAGTDDRATVRLEPAIYANDQLYGTVVTQNTDFSKAHPAQSLDTIYNFRGVQPSVADAAPGDPGFNGGRWAVMLVSWNAGTTPRLLTNADAVEAAIAAGELTAVGPVRYFVCTLIPLN
jgi:hypothetical protein